MEIQINGNLEFWMSEIPEIMFVDNLSIYLSVYIHPFIYLI